MTTEEITQWCRDWFAAHSNINERELYPPDMLKDFQKLIVWKKITPISIPKVGDEVWGPNRELLAVGPNLLLGDEHSRSWIGSGYTHFRPINPPFET